MASSSPTSDLDSLLQDLERTCQARQHHDGRGTRDPAESGLQFPYGSSRLSPNSIGVSPMVSTDGYAVVQDSLRKDVIRELESSSTLIKKRQFEDNILTEKSNLDQSKWEYVGYGIWEDSQTSPGLEEYVIPVQETTKSQSVLNRHVEISTTGKSYSSGITKTLDRSISASSSNGDGRTHFHPSTTTAASSATKELDDLMVSLGKVEAAKATPHPLLLDEMLDNLHIDMNTQGVTSSPKGVCYKCTKPILGQVVTALGRPWHPEHFTCFHCDKALGLETYFERDSQAYCETDYHTLFSPRCANCKTAILDKCISALDQTWHPECFVCSSCLKPFGDDCYHERNGEPFCQACFQGRFLPKCGKCVQPIEDNFISSLGQQWHMDCFVCEECSTPFRNGNYFEHDGKPYCETHYHSLRGSLCAGCHKAISGRCITAMFKKYHPEHFVCSFCLKQLNKGTFKESNEKPYCHDCHGRLFG